MKSALAVVTLASAWLGCSDDSAPRVVPPAVVVVPGDGGVGTAITVPPGIDPTAVHIDNYGTYRQAPTQPLPGRERRAIDVTLRSSPPGAYAAVDGTIVGSTPAFWTGYADGREHQFVFTLPGHAIARYRFVPVSSGVIHARLEPIVEERDAGVAPPPEVVPQPPPSAVVPHAAPPTIVEDAAPIAPPVVAPPARSGSVGSPPAGSSAPTSAPSVGPQP